MLARLGAFGSAETPFPEPLRGTAGSNTAGQTPAEGLTGSSYSRLNPRSSAANAPEVSFTPLPVKSSRVRLFAARRQLRASVLGGNFTFFLKKKIK